MATIKQDELKVAEYLEEVHTQEIPFLKYNNDAEWCAVRNSLSCVITLCYLKARDYYTVTREAKAGIGYVDYLFVPRKKGYPAIVLELKYGHSAQEAIMQIKEKNYIDQVKDFEQILLVGINYDKKDKKHSCIIEQYK